MGECQKWCISQVLFVGGEDEKLLPQHLATYGNRVGCMLDPRGFIKKASITFGECFYGCWSVIDIAQEYLHCLT